MKMADVLSSPILSDVTLAVEARPAQNGAENLVAPFSLLGGLDINATIYEAARCCNVGEAQIEDIFFRALPYKKKPWQLARDR